MLLHCCTAMLWDVFVRGVGIGIECGCVRGQGVSSSDEGCACGWGVGQN
jgi:hypothetical protein